MPLGSDASPSQGYPQHLICQFPFTHQEGGKSVLNTHLLKKQTLFIIKVMENQWQGSFIALFSKRLCRRTKHRAFSIYKKFRKFLFGISVWEENVPFVTSPIRLQAPLRRFTKTRDALVKCSAIFSNASSFVAMPSNKCLLSACVVIRSLTSACSRRSRFTLVETLPVNERTFQRCNILHE